MDLPALTVFGALLTVPAIIGLAQGKDGPTRTILGLAVAIGAILTLSPFVDAIRDLLNGNLIRALAVAAAVLGVLITVRIGNPVLATLTSTGGGLLALQAFGVLS